MFIPPLVSHRYMYCHGDYVFERRFDTTLVAPARVYSRTDSFSYVLSDVVAIVNICTHAYIQLNLKLTSSMWHDGESNGRWLATTLKS